MSPSTLWEIKCVGGVLEEEHFLQLAIYAWLWTREHATAAPRAPPLGSQSSSSSAGAEGPGEAAGGERAFRLMNVLSNEVRARSTAMPCAEPIQSYRI